MKQSRMISETVTEIPLQKNKLAYDLPYTVEISKIKVFLHSVPLFVKC